MRKMQTLAYMHDIYLQYFNESPEIEVLSFSPYPAVPKEHGVLCRGYCGYRIDLAPFNGRFCEIRFRGCGNGRHVVCGYVIDKEGNIESVATKPYDDKGNAVLPLTSISHALYASVPIKKGELAWNRITVQFVYCNQHMVSLPTKVMC